MKEEGLNGREIMKHTLELLILLVVAKEKKKHKKGFNRPRINLEPRDQIAKWDETSKLIFSPKLCVLLINSSTIG